MKGVLFRILCISASLFSAVAESASYSIDFDVGCRDLLVVAPKSSLVETIRSRVQERIALLPRQLQTDLRSARVDAEGRFAVLEFEDSPALLYDLDGHVAVDLDGNVTVESGAPFLIGRVLDRDAVSGRLLVVTQETQEAQMQSWSLRVPGNRISISLPYPHLDARTKMELLAWRSDGSQVVFRIGLDDEFVWNRRAGILSIARIAPGNERILRVEGRVGIVSEFEKGTVVSRLKGHTDAIRAIETNSDFTRAFTLSDDGSARIWNLNTGEQIARLPVEDPGKIESVRANAEFSAITLRYYADERAPVVFRVPAP